MLKVLLDGLGDLVFPQNCILCSAYVADKSLPQLCSSCLSDIEFNAPPFCLRCSRHLLIYTPEGLCPTCLKYPIAFDAAWGAISYNPTVQRLMHSFKYYGQTSVRRVLGRLINEFLTRYPAPLDSFDIGVPMPLDPLRMRERGFNQSAFIAEIINELTGLPICGRGLKRIRHTHPQSSMRAKERWTNMEGAFRMEKNFNINNKSVLLIDDLLTTGATASHAARALKDAGAKRVALFVVALTPLSPYAGRMSDKI